jgi:hypothetical protein
LMTLDEKIAILGMGGINVPRLGISGTSVMSHFYCRIEAS